MRLSFSKLLKGVTYIWFFFLIKYFVKQIFYSPWLAVFVFPVLIKATPKADLDYFQEVRLFQVSVWTVCVFCILGMS